MRRGDKSNHFGVVFLTALFCALAFSVYAQDAPGIQEFGDATREVKRGYHSLTIAIQGLGAIWGLIGGVRVYNNIQSGKHHIDGQVQGWFFACLFFQLIAVCIGGLYGV